MGATASIATGTILHAAEHFPKYGVKLSFCTEFIASCGGEEKLAGKTTEEVCKEFVLPATEAHKSSYCDLLRAHNHEAVGIAQIFISHAWKYKFLDTCNTLRHHFRNNMDVYVWFDLFSYNQHKAGEYPPEWWTRVFPHAIAEIGHTVLVLALDDPVPLVRTWCMWELFCTASTKGKFDIALSKEQQGLFFDGIVEQTENVWSKTLCSADIELTESTNEIESVAIIQSLQESIGLNKCNAVLCQLLQDWAIDLVKQEIATPNILPVAATARLQLALVTMLKLQGRLIEAEPLILSLYKDAVTRNGKDDPESILLAINMAMIYQQYEKMEEAESIFLDCLERRKRVLGENDVLTLSAMSYVADFYQENSNHIQAEKWYTELLSAWKEHENKDEAALQRLEIMANLTNIYIELDRLNDAESLAQERLEITKTLYGELSISMINVYNDFAYIYKCQDRYEESIPMYIRVVLGRKELLGFEHSLTLSTMYNLAKTYIYLGMDEKAEPLLLEYVSIIGRKIGRDHPDTMDGIHALGIVYANFGQYHKTEALFGEYLVYRRTITGNTDPTTLSTMFSLAKVKQVLGKFDEAAELFDECYQSRKAVLGEEHPSTNESLEALQAVLLQVGQLQQEEEEGKGGGDSKSSEREEETKE